MSCFIFVCNHLERISTNTDVMLVWIKTLNKMSCCF